MGKLKINYVILFSIFFIAILNLIYEFGKFIPYYEKNIIHPLTLFDNPYFKNISFLNDLSISLVFFLFIFYSLNKLSNLNNIKHIQILWTLKCFISFFLILIIENSFSKDQFSYFVITINDLSYDVVLGDLSKILDINNPTSNFLIPLKIVEFLFRDSWFAQKLFQNLLYLFSLILFLKIMIKIDNNFSNNIFLIYFIGLLPSFIFFSSFITKDLLIIFLISLILYSFFNLNGEMKNIIKFLGLIILAILYIFFLRKWVAYAVIVSIIIFYSISLLKIKYFNSLLIYLSFFYLIIFFIYSSDFYELINKFTYEIFDRFKMEHFFDQESYQTLFINKGERLEVLYTYPFALYKTLFNPFLEEFKNLKYFIFIFENLILFIFIL